MRPANSADWVGVVLVDLLLSGGGAIVVVGVVDGVGWFGESGRTIHSRARLTRFHLLLLA